MNFFQVREFLSFYRTAVTKYQLHSTFVYELACAALEDERWYYAFRDVEAVRQKMLSSDAALKVVDFGTGGTKASKRSISSIARRSGSSKRQGQMLFRLVNHLNPQTLLELGTSLGISTLYLASAARESQMISIEGSPETAQVARLNLELLGLSPKVEVREGAFETQLGPALQDLKVLDWVFMDGNHQLEATLQYFEQCLAAAHEKTVFVLDDTHWSAGMAEAWAKIQNHPRVTLTLDFFELSLVFIDPDFREKQHFKIVPARWKPWMFF